VCVCVRKVAGIAKEGKEWVLFGKDQAELGRCVCVCVCVCVNSLACEYVCVCVCVCVCVVFM